MKKLAKGRLWFLLAAALMLLFIAACSSGEEEASGTDDASGGDSSGEASGGEEGGGEISGELEIQYFVGGYGDSWWKEVIADFQEEYPDVTITEHAGPNINEEMRSRWVSGDPPDVIYIDGAGSSETQMVEDGQLMNL